MKKHLLASALVLFTACAGLPVQAQPIESEPLAPLEIKPVTEARPLDNVPQEDTPVSSTSIPSDNPQPTSGLPAYPAPVNPPIAPIVPYGGSIGTAPKDKPSAHQKVCALQAVFASNCCGTDMKTAEIMKTYLDANTDKLAYTRNNWGREGEFTYCIDVLDHKNRGKTYTALKKIVTDTPAKNKPVSLSGAGFTPVNNAKAGDAR